MIASFSLTNTQRFSIRPLALAVFAALWAQAVMAQAVSERQKAVQSTPADQAKPLPPILRLSVTHQGKMAKPIDFAILPEQGAACYSYLFRVFGQRSWQVSWRNLAPYGELDFSSSAAAGRGHYLLSPRAQRAQTRWPEGARGALYLGHHSGSSFGDKLIITKGRLAKLDETHLFCGITTAATDVLWHQSQGTSIAVRLIGSRHKVVRYAFLPALSRGKAETLTIKAARKAARSMADTFDLAHPNRLKLANYRRQGELIQVNYTVSFADRDRDLVLIGAYTNGVFATQHLHFSK